MLNTRLLPIKYYSACSCLIRTVSPGGEQRVLMTNLFDQSLTSADCFAKQSYKRWGIEKALKRLKHRLNLDHVTGLTQQAVVQDVAAKIGCDNLQALVVLTPHAIADLPASKRINHIYAHTARKLLLPVLLLGSKVAETVSKMLRSLLKLSVGHSYCQRENCSKPCPPGRKPHKNTTLKIV